MTKKIRLDVLLVDRHLFDSRERAKRFIMSGNVLVDEQKTDKAGALVPIDCAVRLIGNDCPFVSRGGLKLLKAIETFNLELGDRIAIDVGASTGGFTDCMLQHGVRKVFAIDVGYGQLDWKLRNDPRVVCMERTNIRRVTREMFDTPIDFASIDVAFISLDKVLPVVFELIVENAEVVALGREKVGKHGVVREPSVHIEVIERVFDVARTIGFAIAGLTFSPIKGPEGNIEYLARLKKNASECSAIEINSAVAEAHSDLKG